jgi:hypothetical protein
VPAAPIDALRKLLKDPGALRDRYLVRMEKLPSAVKIDNGFGEFMLVRSEGARPAMPHPGLGRDSWTLWRGDTPAPVDPETVMLPSSLVNLFRQKSLQTQPLIDSFIDMKDKKEDQEAEEKKLGLDKPRAKVWLWDDEDGVVAEDAKEPAKPDEKRKKPRLKSDEPTVKLSFGDPIGEGDKRLVAVKREVRRKGGWEVTMMKIKEIALDEARKGPLAYLEKKLDRFTNSGLSPWPGVTSVVIERGKNSIEVKRDKDDEPWKIVRPADEAGRTADKTKVEAVLWAMNQLDAVEFVREKAKDADELDKEWNLKSPPLRVVITMKKDDKPVTYTYDFGKDKSDSEVYAKQSQRDMIFSVSKARLGALPADVLNPVVFEFDPEKVTKVKLSGWGNLGFGVANLEVERKDKEWSVKQAPTKDFKLDADKVKKLVESLKTCKAERWEKFKAPGKGEYDLDLEKGALVIEITEGDKKPITLTVGKADGDKGYFATSNQVDGVFVLPKAMFEKPKEKPAYFSQ